MTNKPDECSKDWFLNVRKSKANKPDDNLAKDLESIWINCGIIDSEPIPTAKEMRNRLTEAMVLYITARDRKVFDHAHKLGIVKSQ